MEYSKEDLMEAKKQIWGVGENMGTEESKKIWEENAQFWDNAMGDESNEFHREVVRPKVTELLSPNPADYILDIACGNGNYSSYLAQRGASVVAFDYSKKMIELAKRRQSQYAKQIEFCVADATDRKSILELKRNRAFTKAVSNMAIMDITDIEPLLMAVYELLQESGIFVFATQHPCFVTLTEKYMTPHSYYDIAIAGADAGRNPALLLSAPAAARDRRVYWPVTQHSGAAYPACLAAATRRNGGEPV